MTEPTADSLFDLKLRPGGLISAAGVLGVVATGIGFLGPFWWAFDLVTHLRMQLALAMLGLAGCCLVFRYRKTALACLIAAGMNAWVILPVFQGAAPNAQGEMEPDFRVLLLNVNSSTGDPDTVVDLIGTEDPDLVVLQEVTDYWMDALSRLETEYAHVISRPRPDNFGIALFSKHPLQDPAIIWVGAADVPSVSARVILKEGELALLATHPLPPVGAAYTAHRNEQVQELPAFMPKGDAGILMGDLNMTPWHPVFRQLCEAAGLTDSAKGYGYKGTWPDLPGLFRIPLDHVLYSPGLMVVDRRVGGKTGSDHRPVIVDFAWSDL